jgi:hypothetical protein
MNERENTGHVAQRAVAVSPLLHHGAPIAGGALLEARSDGPARADLLRRIAAGELSELEFDAIVFRAGPNRNHLRIREEELPAFAASFVGAPFLRDHNVGSVDARAGVVLRSELHGRAIRQRIRLTTQRDMRAYVEGQIDRFSISWFYEEVVCTICGQEWGRCSHRPGRTYAVEAHSQPGRTELGRTELGRTRRKCELLFSGVQGKEVSAVNAPAVEGTCLLGAAAEEADGARRSVRSLQSGAPAPRTGEEQELREHAAVEGRGVEAMISLEKRGEGMSTDAMAVDSDFAASEAACAHTAVSGANGAGLLPHAGAAEQGAGEAARGDAWTSLLRAQAIDTLAQRAGLSAAGRAAVRATLAAEPWADPARAQAIVDAQRQSEARQGGWPVRGLEPLVGGTGGMRTAEDEVQAALDWLVGDTRTPMPAPHLRSLRDLYLAVTGDVNFWGVFNPDYARLQSANSTTLANMAVNALNRAVLLHYDNMLTYRWYEQIVHVLPHDGSTQQLQLVHMDGIATLPQVAEGAAYTEAQTGDSKETATFTKYGSYVGITLEMVRRSEIARIQAIPRLLVQAAIRRRSAAIAAIFTGNPTLADDSTSLFHATHGNSDTAAFSAGAWEAARTRIFEQTTPGTGKPLGLWPTYCLVPIELYDDALTLFGYGSGDVGKPNAAGSAQEPNIYAHTRPGDPRPIPLVVPDWSDATDWAYIVDPRLQPVIVMAYANAPAGGLHALPELFEVRSETAGLIFSHDTLPVKVRDWWAYGVATHVGVGRNAVAG